MEKKNADESSSSFPMGETAQELGFTYVPKCYQVQTSDMPSAHPINVANVPLIDLSGMNDPSRRSILVDEIAKACRHSGFFQVINHGIPEGIVDGAIRAASDFFNMPTKEKAEYMSNDVHNPVRYGTSLKDGEDKVQFWRVFLKHYAHPLQDWVGLWPHNPPDYRQKMGDYVEASQKLAQTITGLITESLGLGPKYLSTKLDQGMQVMAVNCYPPCPQPQHALGLPPHSDYGCLTTILQESPGLQILDPADDSWRSVPVIHGAIQVHIGDQLEVLSNGRYKSVVHRVTLNSEKTRISVAGLHTLGMDVKMKTAEEMVDEENLVCYKESCFRDFLDFISNNDIGQGNNFMDTIKIPK
ncbi:hypothetical protein ABFS82_06G120100 [Erythranthe guttata]|uniref:Fe2OG dioxygenase domain-containing protein n=1 Tax=Erythranthe guttata TaxID=4155 RepID=A0A022R4I1_ERYGU|nr:PREDICTED: flavonol synthase/flavanone 3-hydroxylase [Erythranthe guttata]EYU35161.1 hypothetical protein MIMGU_mgv1a019348mg [Erythranthe guttata]|eukprot:XP_012839942.1 PREDICTED: flavonol synthase/flavanone 3-hydroxylase [Erythranthe guttata]